MTYRRDPVTPEMALDVFTRDGGCVAVRLGEPPASCAGRLTLDHVHEEMGIGKRRAKSDRAHLVALCEGHTERGAKAGRQWNTAHRADLRAYLALTEGAAS
ncbi:MAG: hypothetical protein IMZ67_09215 [Acidobacteria bacterium]|nr:hypothetical protein [Acidobacteriota bacterium]